MKNFVVILLVLIIYSTHVHSQIDTTSLSYYPLNDGDYWEYLYQMEDFSYPPNIHIIYYSSEVIGDTIFPIGTTYKIIETTILDSTQRKSYQFERIDSSTCNVYRYDTYSSTEFLIDSLKSQIGDSCNATRTFPFNNHKTICRNIIQDSILNRMTISKMFEEQHWHSPIEYRLSKGLGLSYLSYYVDFGRLSKYLLYARIDTVEYGTQVNSIPNDNNQIVNEAAAKIKS